MKNCLTTLKISVIKIENWDQIYP